MLRTGLSVSLISLCFTLACSGGSKSRDRNAYTKLTETLREIYAKESRATLTPFGSERELRELFAATSKAVDHAREAIEEEAADKSASVAASPSSAEGQAGSGSESITNTQHANVDEGGIVKLHGDHLVILRRGRLFTVRIGDDSLTPVAHADAFGPGIDPGGAWYDEMLVSGDTAIVIGYSYSRGGTELGLFDLGGDGSIKHRATYHMRSNDYFSSRNYASRIVDGKLVFYSPMYLGMWGGDPMASLPAVRKWRPGATEQEFRGILQPQQIYRPVTGFSADAMHVVTVCDLATRELECRATGLMGPAGRTFYVSENAVYVWATSWEPPARNQTPPAMVVRMPLDGSAPTAIRAQGSPIDQFSFLERDGFLNVLVRSDTAGDAMWAPETTAGDMALLRTPVSLFSSVVANAPGKLYTQLPQPGAQHSFTVQNRFVGDHLLYGAGASWGYAEPKAPKQVFAVRYAGGAPQQIALKHPVDRIEALGADAIVIGGDGQDLHFTSLALDAQASVASSYIRRGAGQGETRSHGFFYKPDPASPRAGLLGLPVQSAAAPGASQLIHGAASITFLRNRELALAPVGELEAASSKTVDDACKASCVDWYGNARPIFVRGRILALMGYELVEGRLANEKLVEQRRVSFAPTE